MWAAEQAAKFQRVGVFETYPNAEALSQIGKQELPADERESKIEVVNRFFSSKKGRDVVIFKEDGRIDWATHGNRSERGMGSGKARKRASAARNGPAERMAKTRARRREGRRVLRVAVDEAAIEMILVDTGHLRAECADDPRAVAEALERMLDHLAATYGRCM